MKQSSPLVMNIVANIRQVFSYFTCYLQGLYDPLFRLCVQTTINNDELCWMSYYFSWVNLVFLWYVF